MSDNDIIQILTCIKSNNNSIGSRKLYTIVENDISLNDLNKIIEWLIKENWIKYNEYLSVLKLGEKKLQELIIAVENEKNTENLKEKELRYNTKLAKFRYFAFIPTLILALIGGVYSSIKIIEHLSTSETNTQEQKTKSEMELEQSTSHTLPLDRKNQDSLYTASPQSQPLRIEK